MTRTKFIQRIEFNEKIDEAFKVTPAVAILGPRQCGKTTEALAFASHKTELHRFDLEDPRDLNKLEDPLLALENLSGLIIIDEVQRSPELFPVLRVLLDKAADHQQYLILGSASRELLRQSSESLAGRINYLELTPFSLNEVHHEKKLWLRGGFPRSFLATDDELSYQWRRAYINTFLEKDIPNLGIQIPAQTLRRFWHMLSHYHGNVLNSAELGRSLGISHTAIRHYLDILNGTFMIRQLSPWFENIDKRQVKTPKIYFRDSGILHNLLGIESYPALNNHPKLGASWEGFALEQIIRHHQADPEDCYFWATHGGAELDLLIMKNDQRLGFEFKYSSTPKFTQSMQIAIEDLKLNALKVIYPGNDQFLLTKHKNLTIQAQGLEQYIS